MDLYEIRILNNADTPYLLLFSSAFIETHEIFVFENFRQILKSDGTITGSILFRRVRQPEGSRYLSLDTAGLMDSVLFQPTTTRWCDQRLGSRS
jgi:hypothetical protein